MTQKVDLFDIKYNLDVVIERQIEYNTAPIDIDRTASLQNAKNKLFELLKVYIVEEAKKRKQERSK